MFEDLCDAYEEVSSLVLEVFLDEVLFSKVKDYYVIVSFFAALMPGFNKEAFQETRGPEI